MAYRIFMSYSGADGPFVNPPGSQGTSSAGAIGLPASDRDRRTETQRSARFRRRRSVSSALGSPVWDAFTPHYTPTHGSWLNRREFEAQDQERVAIVNGAHLEPTANERR